MSLSPRQKRFCDEYLIDLNATRAYKAAYLSVKKDETAAVNASRLLRNAKVAAYIQKQMDDRARRTEISQDRVLQELAKIGFSDITDFVTIEEEGVRVKPTSEMPREKIGSIAGIKEGANGIEVKLYGKEKALELIGRHLGMFRDKVELSGQLTTENPFADLTTEELKKLIRGG